MLDSVGGWKLNAKGPEQLIEGVFINLYLAVPLGLMGMIQDLQHTWNKLHTWNNLGSSQLLLYLVNPAPQLHVEFFLFLFFLKILARLCIRPRYINERLKRPHLHITCINE